MDVILLLARIVNMHNGHEPQQSSDWLILGTARLHKAGYIVLICQALKEECGETIVMVDNKKRPGKDIDRIDRKILNELQKDGRISNVELSKRVGLSPQHHALSVFAGWSVRVLFWVIRRCSILIILMPHYWYS